MSKFDEVPALLVAALLSAGYEDQDPNYTLWFSGQEPSEDGQLVVLADWAAATAEGGSVSVWSEVVEVSDERWFRFSEATPFAPYRGWAAMTHDGVVTVESLDEVKEALR